MNITKKWFVALFGAVAMAGATTALAQQPANPIYIGADIGNADFGSTDDTAFKVFGGYQFHRNIAAEVAYSSLLDKSGVEVSALELVAVGIFPVTPQLSILGKFGFANIDVDPGDRKTELTFGIGAQFDVTPKIGVRAQWQRYDTDPNEIDLITIGVLVRF